MSEPTNWNVTVRPSYLQAFVVGFAQGCGFVAAIGILLLAAKLLQQGGVFQP